MIEIKCLNVGPIQTNCYIVYKKDSKECVVFDPGFEGEKIANYIKDNGLELKAILLTHGHFDHILGVTQLVEMTGAKVYAGADEKELLMDANLNCSTQMGRSVGICPDCFLKDGEDTMLAGIKIKTIFTPGHTKGSVCFYIEDEKTLFSGDTIFFESIGRTDFPTGNERKLLESLREIVLALPGDVSIHPGHGPQTYVEYEINNNPFA